jgi:hypothetical protein
MEKCKNPLEDSRQKTHQVNFRSISPTFHEQLMHPKSFRQKITNPNCRQIKAAQKAFI